MKRPVIGALIGCLLAGLPAGAEVRTISHASFTYAFVPPCALACTYNIDTTTTACSDPAPDGSYADKVVVAPRGANTLIFTASPVVDWDTFICFGRAMLGRSLRGAGEQEVILANVRAGRRYILRAYNFSDVDDLPASYVFKYVA